MKSLPDLVFSTFQAISDDSPNGVGLSRMSTETTLSHYDLNDVISDLCNRNLVRLIKRGTGKYIIPFDHPDLSCVVCDKHFIRSRKSRRITCSRSCAISLSWQNEESKATRIASIKAERNSPAGQARIEKFNKYRWSRPGEREKLSRRNREDWADPYKKAKLSAGIARAQRTPERRKAQSDAISKRWNNPEGREKLLSGMAESKKTPEYKEGRRRAMKKRWADPEQREHLTKVCSENLRKATENNKGKHQSPETIAKRVASRKRNMEARR